MSCRQPHGHGKTTTFSGALRLSGITAPMVLDGAVNADAFRAYIEQVLKPILRPRDIVIMDNLPALTVVGIREAIGGRWSTTVSAGTSCPAPPWALECDTIQFRKKFSQANVTSLVERISRFTVLLRNNDRQSRPVMDGVIRVLQPLPQLARRSITVDRGTKFTGLICRMG